MAIYARPVDTRFNPTLMSRVLPSLIKNRVRFGLKKKKKSPKWVQVLVKTQPEPTRLNLSRITKIPTYLYIYIYNLYQTLRSLTLFSFLWSLFSSSRLSLSVLSPSITLSLIFSHATPHGLTQSPSPSLSFTHWPTLTFTLITWWLLFAKEKHGG